MSEIFSKLKKQIPIGRAGSRILPHIYAITPGEREGSRHFHFQHGQSDTRRIFTIKNVYKDSVQLTCFHRSGKNKCAGRLKLSVNDKNMILEDGDRESKEAKRTKTKPKYRVNPELGDVVMRPKSWSVIPTSAIDHSDWCKPVARLASVRDTFRSQNGKDSISCNRNLTTENFRSWLRPFARPDLVGEPGQFGSIVLSREIKSVKNKLSYAHPEARTDRVPDRCKSFLMANETQSTSTESFSSLISTDPREYESKFLWKEDQESIVFFDLKELELIDDVGKINHGLPPTHPVGYDGTFFSSRDIPYQQLFSLCVYKPDPNDSTRGISIPVVMAYLKKRTTADYINLFKFISKIFEENYGRPLRISYVIGDFECASRKAFIEVFNSIVRNCKFHSLQNFQRKLKKYCGVEYYKHEDLLEFFQIMAGLIFIEKSFVPIVFEKLKLHVQTVAKRFQAGLNKFLIYFREFYLERPSYAGWNLYDYLDNNDMIHTNNMLEGIHGKLKRMTRGGTNTIQRAAELVYDFKDQNMNAVLANDYKKKKKATIEKHRQLKIRFEEILLHSQDEEWRNKNCLIIARQLHIPEDDILPFESL